MDNNNIYYTPPKQKAFEDMKKQAIAVWKTYDDTYKYPTGKIDKIKNLENVADNFMFIFAMFDVNNQNKVVRLINKQTLEEVKKRLPKDYLANYLFIYD